MEHELKCWPEFFDAIKAGDKTFEIRENDRGFQKGDLLVLRKFNPRGAAPGHATVHPVTYRRLPPEGCYAMADGRPCYMNDAATLRVRVTYVLASAMLAPGHVAIGFKIEEMGNG